MEFSFTEEQEILRTQVRKLLEDVCPPEYAAKCDVDAVPPREAYNAMAEQGWLRLILPEEYGGVGGPRHHRIPQAILGATIPAPP